MCPNVIQHPQKLRAILKDHNYLSLKQLIINYIFDIQDNPLENLNLAFDIAEKYLDIPKMLDAEGKKSANSPWQNCL